MAATILCMILQYIKLLKSNRDGSCAYTESTLSWFARKIDEHFGSGLWVGDQPNCNCVSARAHARLSATRT